MSDSTGITAGVSLSSIIIHVLDVAMLDRCRDWYGGIGLTPSPPDSPGESCWFDIGSGAQLGIHVGGPVKPEGFSLGLLVNDVEQACERLVGKGYEFVSRPELKPWGRSPPW